MRERARALGAARSGGWIRAIEDEPALFELSRFSEKRKNVLAVAAMLQGWGRTLQQGAWCVEAMTKIGEADCLTSVLERKGHGEAQKEERPLNNTQQMTNPVDFLEDHRMYSSNLDRVDMTAWIPTTGRESREE